MPVSLRYSDQSTPEQRIDRVQLFEPGCDYLDQEGFQMNRQADLALNFDEYSRKTALEKAKRATLAKDIFLVAVLFLVASGAAYYYEATIVAGGLFFVFLIIQQVASETRLEIAMIDANGWLALLVNQQARDLDRLRSELKQQQFVRTL